MNMTRKIWIRNSIYLPFSRINIQDLIPIDYRNLVLQATRSTKEYGYLIEFKENVDLLMMNSYLNKMPLLKRCTVKQVKGDPFIQDLIFDKVSRRLFISKHYSSKQEVFKEFRPYGKLLQVKKDGDGFIVDFLKVMDAVDARLCLDHKGDITYQAFKYDFKGFKWVRQVTNLVDE
jgi:hypothetical protein